MFNLSSNFLTHRDAWAGTFEQVVGELTSPRTDCPGDHDFMSLSTKFQTYLKLVQEFSLCAEVLPEVAPVRQSEADESREVSEFQGEVVQLAGVLKGDHLLSSFGDEMGKKMKVREGHDYVKGAVSRFIRASKEAVKMGAEESSIVEMRSSLTTRSSSLHH